MANQTGPRLAGDDYQHLLAWAHLLEMLIPGSSLRQVTVEDPDAAFVDDITLRHESDAGKPDTFLQVKYHVDHRGLYSTEVLLAAQPGARSLLRKFYESWLVLREKGDRQVELRLVTNWTWDPDDPVRGCIRGDDSALSEAFFNAPRQSEVGKAASRWVNHLGLASDEFRAFASTLRLRLGFDCADELRERVAERMMFLRLKHDIASLLVVVGIVRELIKKRRGALARADVEDLLAAHDLHLPIGSEPATTIYLTTVKEQRFDLPPDFLLDWRGWFAGDESKRFHRVLDPSSWNTRMLPELLALERRLNESSVRTIRARGLARLSAWFAFGQTFSDVARYTIEVDQQGKLWRTDAVPSSLKVVETSRHEISGGEPDAVAVGISVTGLLDTDVTAYLNATRVSSAVAFLRPDRELGRDSFSSAADVTAFARGAKELMQRFVRQREASRLLLFYFGPLSGACFLGHQLNAVADQVQIMEDQAPGYAPSFLLS